MPFLTHYWWPLVWKRWESWINWWNIFSSLGLSNRSDRPALIFPLNGALSCDCSLLTWPLDQIGNESSKTSNWILKSKPLKEHNRKCNFALFENVQKVLDLNSNFLKWPNIFHLLATFHNEVNAVSNENVQKIHNFQGFLFLKNLNRKWQ